MSIISILLLILVPVSLVFVVLALIRMRGRGIGFARELKQRSILYLVIPAAVCVASLAVLLFTGKFYSMSMTFQMPPVTGTQATGNLHDDDYGEVIRLSSREDVKLTGDKVVTFNQDFGAPINLSQEVFFAIENFVGGKLFRYSDQYIPRQYRATSASDVGYIVFIDHVASSTSAVYTNGAKAYRHDIEVMICDDNSVLAACTVQGNLAPDTTGDDTLGPAPDKKVSEWVAEQLEMLISEKPATTAVESVESDAAIDEGREGTWTTKEYSANLEREAEEDGIDLLPNEHNGSSFYVYYLGSDAASDEVIDIEEQPAGLLVRTSINKDSQTVANKDDIYLLVLHSGDIRGGKTIRILGAINDVLEKLPDDDGATVVLEYPEDGFIIEIDPRVGKWNVNFTFVG